MRLVFLFIIVLLLSGCASTPDPVDRLVSRLSASHGLWLNGFSPILDLPATASTEQVVSRVFQMTGFDRGHVTRWKILKVRAVHIPPDTGAYTAVIVDTDFGRKIVLLEYEGASAGWWSRIFDLEPAGS